MAIALDQALKNFSDITPDYRMFAESKDKCRTCSIYNHYCQVVQSEGNASNPTFMFIGEAPGSDEVTHSKPFIGRAGQRLRHELRKYPSVFNKKTTILTNTICCRPPNNKFPNKDGEYSLFKKGKTRPVSHTKVVLACTDQWLKKEIEILSPKVIITLGAQALYYVREQRGISDLHGNWFFMPKYRAWTYATYHPSYVLRCANDSLKKHVVTEFEKDIRILAETWSEIISSDRRMQMSEVEWKHVKAVETCASFGILKDQAIEVDDDLSFFDLSIKA